MKCRTMRWFETSDDDCFFLTNSIYFNKRNSQMLHSADNLSEVRISFVRNYLWTIFFIILKNLFIAKQLFFQNIQNAVTGYFFNIYGKNRFCVENCLLSNENSNKRNLEKMKIRTCDRYITFRVMLIV